MDAATTVGLIIQGALLLITALAAVIAWKQTQVAMGAKDEARRARDDASAHEQAALAAAAESAIAARRSADAAERSADSGERSAAAVEEQTALLRADREPRHQWALEHRKDNIWALVNNTGMEATWATVHTNRGAAEDRILPAQDIWDDVAPGASLLIEVLKHFEHLDLTVMWHDSRAGFGSKRFTEILAMRPGGPS